MMQCNPKLNARKWLAFSAYEMAFRRVAAERKVATFDEPDGLRLSNRYLTCRVVRGEDGRE